MCCKSLPGSSDESPESATGNNFLQRLAVLNRRTKQVLWQSQPFESEEGFGDIKFYGDDILAYTANAKNGSIYEEMFLWNILGEQTPVFQFDKSRYEKSSALLSNGLFVHARNEEVNFGRGVLNACNLKQKQIEIIRMARMVYQLAKDAGKWLPHELVVKIISGILPKVKITTEFCSLIQHFNQARMKEELNPSMAEVLELKNTLMRL